MKLCVLSILFTTRFLPLIYALIGFGLLITIHECGHFFFCKLFGIHTPTFSIGMGPTLLKRKVGNTNFRLALIPIGGYVEIAGMAEVGQGEQEYAQDTSSSSFAAKSYWKKFLVLIGGILFNMLFAYGVFSVLYMVGMPVQKEVALVVTKVEKLKDGTEVGLKVGDCIVGVNKYELEKDPKKLAESIRMISAEITKTKPQWITVGAMRDGVKVYVDVPSTLNGSEFHRGILAGTVLAPQVLKLVHEKYSFFSAIQQGIRKTHEWVCVFWKSLKILVTKRNLKDFGGPIMIISESFKRAQKGLLWLFVFLAIISINLAIINLLPIGALDGGQLLFETIEAIIRRKIPAIVRLIVNLASWVLILSLILFLSYQDIRRLLLSYKGIWKNLWRTIFGG